MAAFTHNTPGFDFTTLVDRAVQPGPDRALLALVSRANEAWSDRQSAYQELRATKGRDARKYPRAMHKIATERADSLLRRVTESPAQTWDGMLAKVDLALLILGKDARRGPFSVGRLALVEISEGVPPLFVPTPPAGMLGHPDAGMIVALDRLQDAMEDYHSKMHHRSSPSDLKRRGRNLSGAFMEVIDRGSAKAKTLDGLLAKAQHCLADPADPMHFFKLGMSCLRDFAALAAGRLA
ncbi:MAG: hypothetical protein DI601_24840 [Azospirillum brasilense]|nr:MAG: hypothetical protein DI601_24840 [Azospirillum brasilense]